MTTVRSKWSSTLVKGAAALLAVDFLASISAVGYAQVPLVKRGDVRPDDFKQVDVSAPFTFNGITLIPEPSTTVDCQGHWRIGLSIPSVTARPSKERLLEIDKTVEAYAKAASPQCPSVTIVNYNLAYRGYDNQGSAQKKDDWQPKRLKWHRQAIEQELRDRRRATLDGIPMPQPGASHPLAKRGFAYSVELGETDTWTMYAAWPTLSDFQVGQRHRKGVVVVEHDVAKQSEMLEWRVNPQTNYIEFERNFSADVDGICAQIAVSINCSGSEILHYAKGLKIVEFREFDRKTDGTRPVGVFSAQFTASQLPLFTTFVYRPVSGTPRAIINTLVCWTSTAPDLSSCQESTTKGQVAGTLLTSEGRINATRNWLYEEVMAEDTRTLVLSVDQFNLVRM